MKRFSILLVAVFIVVFYVFRYCCEYKKIISVYKYKNIQIYRHDYYDGFEANWLQFSSSYNLQTGWLIEATSNGGVDGTIQGRFEIYSNGITFYNKECDLKLLRDIDSLVNIQKDMRSPIYDEIGIPHEHPPIMVSLDSCLVNFDTPLKWANTEYQEWLSANPHFKNIFSFEILDTISVIVY